MRIVAGNPTSGLFLEKYRGKNCFALKGLTLGKLMAIRNALRKVPESIVASEVRLFLDRESLENIDEFE